MQFIIILGNVTDGLTFMGPYKVYEVALSEAERLRQEEWRIAELTPAGQQKVEAMK